MKKKIGLKYTRGHLLLFFHDIENTLHGIIAVYAEYKFVAGTKHFMKINKKILENFESKVREFTPTLFARVIVKPDPERSFLEKTSYSNQI